MDEKRLEAIEKKLDTILDLVLKLCQVVLVSTPAAGSDNKAGGEGK